MNTQMIDRPGMIQDVHAIERSIWHRGGYSLSGEPSLLVHECMDFAQDLAFTEYCPELRGLGLKGKIDSHSYRCGNCDKMQNAGTLMIWISDGTMTGDPLWAIKENNGGDGTGWCVPCVRELIRKAT